MEDIESSQWKLAMNETSASIWETIFSGKEEENIYEEIANSITHLIGIFASMIAIYMLLLIIIQNRKSKEHVIGCLIYGLCLLLLYAFSTIYHSVGVFYHKDEIFKEKFRTLDHIAIYFMIAGCYTPMTLINLVKNGHVKTGYFVLVAIWLCAIGGSATKIFMGVDNISPLLSNGFYIFMGWFIVLAMKPIIQTCPLICFQWQVYSGLCYSIGVAFLIWDSLQFNHAIWHLHVMAGSFFGFIGIMLSAIYHSEHSKFKLTDLRGTWEIIRQNFVDMNNPHTHVPSSEDRAETTNAHGSTVRRSTKNKPKLAAY